MKPAKIIKIRFIEIVFKLFGFAILQKDIDKSPFFENKKGYGRKLTLNSYRISEKKYIFAYKKRNHQHTKWVKEYRHL